MAPDHEEASESTAKKKVDESWKDSAKKQEDVAFQEPQESSPPDTGFPYFISTLGMQALMSLGEFPDPVNQEKKLNLPQAKYLIDVIEMLADKTKGNLSKDEDEMTQGLLYELRVKFIEKNKAL